MKYSQQKNGNKSPIITNPSFSSMEDMQQNDTSQPTTTSSKNNWAWISDTGNSLTSILDVILNGNNPNRQQSNMDISLQQNKSNLIWWVVGAIVIIGIIIGISLFLRKKK